MEIVIILFFLAILIGAGFLGLLIFIFYKLSKRKRKQDINLTGTGKEDEKN